MSVYIRRYKRLTEDEQQQSSSNKSQSAANAEIEKLNQDIITCKNAINTAERRYQEEKRRQNDIILQKSQQIAALGGSSTEVPTKNESLSFKFSRKLYEAVQKGKLTELQDIILSTFDILPDLSYHMDEKSSYNFGRKIIAFLNEQNWTDGENHQEELNEFLQDTISNMNISLSKREINNFISAFFDILQTRSLFAWIFGNVNTE